MTPDKSDSSQKDCSETQDTGGPSPPGQVYEHYRHPTEGEHRTAEQFNWRYSYRLNVGIAVAAALAAAFACLTYLQTKRQADYAAASLLQANRAWVDVQIDESSIEIDWTKPEPMISAKITSRNVGGSPAINSSAFAILLLTPRGSEQDIYDEVRLHCSGKQRIGNILFMQETRTFPIRTTDSDEDIVRMVKDIKSAVGDKRSFATPLSIALCARYKIVGSDTVHQTARLFAITDEGSLVARYVKFGEVIAKGSVHIRPEFQGEYAD